MNVPIHHSLIMKPVLFLVVTFLSFALCGCNSNSNKMESGKIDSLIEIQKINDNCLLLTFGADAVSAINTEKGIVVIDAGIASKLTARYRKIIEKEFEGNDFACLIYTHAHPDHFGGSSIFTGCNVAGHFNCSEAIEAYRQSKDKTQKLEKIYREYSAQLDTSKAGTDDWNEAFTQKIRYGDAWLDAKNETPFLHPDNVFADNLVLDMGNTTIEMTCFGGFHSESDILIFVPEMSVLFTGDLFSAYGRPAHNPALTADSARWLQTVQWIEKRISSINTIVGGHGQVETATALKDFTDAVKSKSY